MKAPDSREAVGITLSGSGVVGIHGRRGVGKSRLAATLVAGARHIFVGAASLPDADQRQLVVDAAQLFGLEDAPDSDATWEDILSWLFRQEVASVVFDGLGALLDGNRRFLVEVAGAWQPYDAEGIAPTLVFVDEDRDVIDKLRDLRSPFVTVMPGSPVAESSPEIFRVDPLDFRGVANRCANWSAEDVVAGFAIFGGFPRRVHGIDPAQRLATNVIRLILSPSGALFDAPLDHLRSCFQSPARYAAIVRALAGGANSWKSLRERIPELSGAGPLAPYLHRLEALDVVRVRQSLDAAPRARRRRYVLLDPFEQFWWSDVLPLRAALISGTLDPERAWKKHIEPRLTGHVSRVFPMICRQYLGAFGLGPTGTKAREIGALWGDGYDIPVAGTLENGSIAYGDCHWHDRRPTEAWLDRLQEQVRRTRYGFGREARVRLLFTREQPKERLRQALLRSEWIQRVGPSEMVAAARRAG